MKHINTANGKAGMNHFISKFERRLPESGAASAVSFRLCCP